MGLIQMFIKNKLYKKVKTIQGKLRLTYKNIGETI